MQFLTFLINPFYFAEVGNSVLAQPLAHWFMGTTAVQATGKTLRIDRRKLVWKCNFNFQKGFHYTLKTKNKYQWSIRKEINIRRGDMCDKLLEEMGYSRQFSN